MWARRLFCVYNFQCTCFVSAHCRNIIFMQRRLEEREWTNTVTCNLTLQFSRPAPLYNVHGELNAQQMRPRVMCPAGSSRLV